MCEENEEDPFKDIREAAERFRRALVLGRANGSLRVIEKAYGTFQEQAMDTLYRAALRRLRWSRDAEELAQDVVCDVMSMVWSKLPTLSSETQFDRYCYGAVRNKAVDLYRKYARQRRIRKAQGNDYIAGCVHGGRVEPTSERRPGKDFEKALSRLRPDHRLLVELIVVDERTYKDAGRIVRELKGREVEENTLKTWCHRGLANLRRELGIPVSKVGEKRKKKTEEGA